MRLIHIGCHKCGSTFIQDEVFRKLRNPWAVHPGHTKGFLDLLREWFDLVYCADPYFETEKDRVYSAIRSRITSPEAILSWEGFSGHGSALGQGYHIPHIARRLRELYPEAGILIIIRNQRTFIASIYKDDVTYGITVPFREWFEWRERYSAHNYVKYSVLIETYQRLFGRSRVRVLLFEELFSEEVFRRLFEEFGVDPAGLEHVDFRRRHNPSFGRLAFLGTLLVNRFAGSKLNLCDRESWLYGRWRWRYAPKIDRWAKRWAWNRLSFDFPGLDERLRKLYHEDNLRTSELIGRDLQAVGYV